MIRQKVGYIYIPIAAFYLLLSYIYPLDNATIARRHLGVSAAQAVSFSVAVCMLALWVIALYSASRLRQYSSSIRQYQDGAAFVSLSAGVQLLAWYLPVRGIAKLAFNYWSYLNPAISTPSNILMTYGNLLISLIAFLLIGRGAHAFMSITRARVSLRLVYLLGGAFIVLAVWYCYTSLTASSDIMPYNWLVIAQHGIPILTRLATVVAPYLFMWLVGLIAVYEILLYQRNVKGIVYRRSLQLLSSGLAAVVVVSICLQLATANARSLQMLPFALVVTVTYSLIILLGIAFVLILKGVDRLQQLERL